MKTANETTFKIMKDDYGVLQGVMLPETAHLFRNDKGFWTVELTNPEGKKITIELKSDSPIKETVTVS